MMVEGVDSIGILKQSPMAMQHPPVIDVLEQARVEEEQGESATGAENRGEVQHHRDPVVRRLSVSLMDLSGASRPPRRVPLKGM
jgi:hypothetical protein